jgi:hypothetical protein
MLARRLLYREVSTQTPWATWNPLPPYPLSKSPFLLQSSLSGCDFVELHEKILDVAKLLRLRFFRSFSSSRSEIELWDK